MRGKNKVLYIIYHMLIKEDQIGIALWTQARRSWFDLSQTISHIIRNIEMINHITITSVVQLHRFWRYIKSHKFQQIVHVFPIFKKCFKIHVFVLWVIKDTKGFFILHNVPCFSKCQLQTVVNKLFSMLKNSLYFPCLKTVYIESTSINCTIKHICTIKHAYCS